MGAAHRTVRDAEALGSELELVPVLPTEPPADVLERLQRLDARARLAYVGEDTWVLGRLMLNDERQERARKLLADELELPTNLQRPVYVRLLRLYAQGLRVWKTYTGEQVRSGLAEREFERGLFGIRNTPDREAMAASLRAASREPELEAQLARARDFVESEFRSIHRSKMRHRVITHGRGIQARPRPLIITKE